MSDLNDKIEEQRSMLGGAKADIDIWTTENIAKEINEKEDEFNGVSIFLSRVFQGMNYISTMYGTEQAEDIGSFILALLEGGLDSAVIIRKEDDDNLLGGISNEQKNTVH